MGRRRLDKIGARIGRWETEVIEGEMSVLLV